MFIKRFVESIIIPYNTSENPLYYRYPMELLYIVIVTKNPVTSVEVKLLVAAATGSMSLNFCYFTFILK